MRFHPTITELGCATSSSERDHDYSRNAALLKEMPEKIGGVFWRGVGGGCPASALGVAESRAVEASSSQQSRLPWGREWDIDMDAKVAGTTYSGDSSKKCQGQLVVCTQAKDSGLCVRGREPVFIQPDQLGG